jgi:hypothetical protein
VFRLEQRDHSPRVERPTTADLTFCQIGVKRSTTVALFARQHERVSIGIREDGKRAPWLLRGRTHELDTTSRQLLVRLLDVVACQRTVERRAWPRAALIGREEHDASVGRSNPQLDPALSVVERLIGEDIEADDVGPELQCAILIAGGNADELDV